MDRRCRRPCRCHRRRCRRSCRRRCRCRFGYESRDQMPLLAPFVHVGGVWPRRPPWSRQWYNTPAWGARRTDRSKNDTQNPHEPLVAARDDPPLLSPDRTSPTGGRENWALPKNPARMVVLQLTLNVSKLHHVNKRIFSNQYNVHLVLKRSFSSTVHGGVLTSLETTTQPSLAGRGSMTLGQLALGRDSHSEPTG